MPKKSDLLGYDLRNPEKGQIFPLAYTNAHDIRLHMVAHAGCADV
jgi:hypothetical protein